MEPPYTVLRDHIVQLEECWWPDAQVRMMVYRICIISASVLGCLLFFHAYPSPIVVFQIADMYLFNVNYSS